MVADIERTLIHEHHTEGVDFSYAAGLVPPTTLRIYQEENGDITVCQIEGTELSVVTLDAAALAAIAAATGKPAA